MPTYDPDDIVNEMRTRAAMLGWSRIAAAIAGALLLIFAWSTWFFNSTLTARESEVRSRSRGSRCGCSAAQSSSRRSRRRSALDIELHQALGHELHHLAQYVDVGYLPGELGQCHRGVGHRHFLWT